MTTQNSLPILLIVTLGILNCVNISHADKNCTKLRTKFSTSSQGFLSCAIANSEPITYCRKCGKGFAAIPVDYNALVTEDDCKSEYFSQDRLNIINIVFSNAQSLWNAGSCSNCYDWVDGNIIQNESKITTKFFDNLELLKICIDKFDNNTVCSNCIDDYNNVNGLYEEIKKKTVDSICFDIKDAMNKTRLQWSHDLKCCKDRKTSLTAFIVSSVMISVLIPFAFYTSFMFFGWRREQLQVPLIDSVMEYSSTSRQVSETIEPPTVVPAIAQLLDFNTTA